VITRQKTPLGFTLAELLIALVILGEIATFTIPKIIYAQQTQKNNAVVKEAAAAMAGAFYQMNVSGVQNSSTTAGDATPYLNYINYVTDGSLTVDSYQGSTTNTCTAPNGCIILSSGAAIRFGRYSFAGTASTNAITFTIDPDGRVTDGTTNGPGKSVNFYLTYWGQLSTNGSPVPAGVTYHGSVATASPSDDPSWFQW